MNGTSRAGLRLIAVSAGALLTELALIRLLPGYVRVVGYFSNLILVASFFGPGLGALVSHRFRLLKIVAIRWKRSAPGAA